jgi:membrane-associated phospholipid phosphatase
VLTAAIFYAAYTVIRDAYASEGGAREAQRNAVWIIRAERDLHIYVEQQMQHAVLGWHLFLEFWNTWYGLVHFVAVIGVLVFLYRRKPERYPLWRNTFALMNLIALLGFSFFPLMPPRLMPASYHFVDTLVRYGSPWDFSSGPAAQASDQFAAMPSMHTGWSTWCALALLPLIKPWWGKVVIFAYPAATIYGIVVTGNHWLLDAVGGLVALGVAYIVARPLTARWAARTWLRPAVIVPDH